MLGMRPSLVLVALVAGTVGVAGCGSTRGGDARTPALTNKKNLALTRSLTNFLAAPDAFRDFVTPLSRGTPVTVSVANSDAACSAKKAKVTITPFHESWKIHHKKDFRDKAKTAPDGYILAQIDVADCDFKRIGLKAGRRAYWVVNLDDNLFHTTHFIDVGLSQPPAGAPAEATDLTANHRWLFGECPQEHTFSDDAAAVQTRVNACYAHDQDATRFQAMGIMRTPVTTQSGQTVYLMTDIPEPPEDQLVWIVCADGCCYADQVS